MKDDGSFGHYHVKSTENKFKKKLDSIDYNEKNNHIHLYIILDNIKFCDDNNKILFDSGHYFKHFKFNNDDTDNYQSFHHFLFRILSLHLLCLGEIFPFIVYVLSEKEKLFYPIDRSIKLLNFHNINDRWKIMQNDVDILNKIIECKSEFENAIIWHTLGNLSKTNLETFMCFFRSIESFGRNHFGKGRKWFSYAIKFMEENNIEESKLTRIKDFRNSIAHGDDTSLEFNSDLVNIRDELEQISYKFICKEIRSKRIKELINTDFERNYHIFIDDTTKEIKVYDSGDFFSKKFNFPHTIKNLAAWEEEDIQLVLNLNTIHSSIKNDIKHYLKLKEKGLYKKQGFVYRKTK